MKILRLTFALAALALATAVEAHGPAARVATAAADPAAPRAGHAARDLTTAFLDRAEAHGRATVKAASQAALLEAARERRAYLTALMPHDPAEVLRVALPARIRDRLPAEVRELVEESVEATGDLEVLHVDHVDAAHDHYVHTLDTPSGRYALHFAGGAPDAKTGARAHVRGVRLGDAIVVDGRADLYVDKLAAAPNTKGAQKTLAILVNFANAPTNKPYTVAQVQSVVFGTTSAFDYETSYQQTTLTGDVAGWFTIAASSAGCDFNAIATQGRAAAQAAGYSLAAYDRYVYIFPSAACAWWGLGTVGGAPSHAWIHTKWGLSLNVVGHELGHNLGLFHAHSLDCGANSLGTSGCYPDEYGDVFDLMGKNSGGHFSAYQKERLGWLDDGVSPPITTVPAVVGTATYDIAPLENANDGLSRALKIPRATACGVATEWLYVEARQAKGYDAFLAGNANVLSGVLVHKVTDNVPDTGYLLDMTPGTSSWSDAALTVGKTFTDPQSGVKIMPVSVNGGGARVSVTFPAASCTRAAPTMTLAPGGTVWTPAGVAVSYTVQAQNRDGCGCAPTAFDVGAAVPNGWGSTVARTAAVSPGATAVTSILVTPAQAAATSFYPLSITAKSVSAPTYVASAPATVAVQATTSPPPPPPPTTTAGGPLSTTVAPGAASYKRPRFSSTGVSITVNATRNGVAVGGAAVSVEVRNPSGKPTTLTATTGASGTATVSYLLRSDASTGTYAITSKTTSAGSTSTATSSFVAY